jgi:hypothetical protein
LLKSTSAWKKAPSDPAKLAALKEEAKKQGKIIKEVMFFRHGNLLNYFKTPCSLFIFFLLNIFFFSRTIRGKCSS